MNPIRILVAEDHDLNFELVHELLELHGYAVTRARDGEEALELARSGEFELLLLDLHMPKISGFDVIRELRSSAETERMKILVMSAESMPVADPSARVGADGFLLKPFAVDELYEAVERLTA